VPNHGRAPFPLGLLFGQLIETLLPPLKQHLLPL
jgi:hypothetical protein